MHLKAVIIENFRSYRERTRIDLDDQLTALIGKNDAGKSTVLEALEIFFNSDQVKFEKDDLCVHQRETRARIGCIFSNFPEDFVIDARATTTLEDEFLVNDEGCLEVHKIFDCSLKTVKEAVVAIAQHPTTPEANSLLLKKNDELKKSAADMGVQLEGVDQRSNVMLRKAIRDHVGELNLATTEIPLDAEDAKKAWDQLKRHLPIYALFRADRPSQDADNEVQNPLKIAVQRALKDLQPEIDRVQDEVRSKAQDVALRTLEKLKQLDPRLAAELRPDFKTEPKWDKLFNFSLTGDDGIPINKRGSGARRLILISFFRAEAEERRQSTDTSNVIYAIEEPETSQNPLNQRLIVESLLELSEQSGIQVLLTTHTPGLAGLLPKDALRHIEQNDDKMAVITTGEGILLKVARELGITADIRLQALICVEGPGDVEYLKHFSALLHGADNTLVNLSTDPRIAFIPLGGETLKQWVENHYLHGLHIPEVHIYDKGGLTPPKYQVTCDAVNARTDGSWGVLTTRYEIENYLHPEVIQNVLEVESTMDANSDVVVELIQLSRAKDGEADWEGLGVDKKKKLEHQMKRRLMREVLPNMTLEQLQEIDTTNEMAIYMRRVTSMLHA